MATQDMLRARMRWVEIDHAALAHNVRTLQTMLRESQLWAVVKGQAYGHGAPQVARTALAAGAAGLTVSALSEALELRRAGVDGPLFVMNPVVADQADLYVKYRLIASVANDEAAKALSRAVTAAGRGGDPTAPEQSHVVEPWSHTVPVHVKVDTGLGRFGTSGDIIEFTRRLNELPGIEVQGVFSHFASADDVDQTTALGQLSTFDGLLGELTKLNLRPPVAHMCNSPAALVIPQARLQMARSGLAVYGMYPSESVREQSLQAGVILKPALTLKARVAAVRRLPAGSPIGYGGTSVTTEETTVITLPIGYSDGVSRNLSGKLQGIVHGQRRPLLGRVCMNHIMIDAGNIPVQIGDVVTLLGQDGDERVPAEEWADYLGTVSYEIVCMVGSRNPRVHLYDGAPAAVVATRDADDTVAAS